MSASSETQLALTLAYGLVFSSSHWPSSLPDMMAPRDLSQLPSGSAGGEKTDRNWIDYTKTSPSNTAPLLEKRTDMYVPTHKDKLLKTAGYLQSNAAKPSPSKLPNPAFANREISSQLRGAA